MNRGVLYAIVAVLVLGAAGAGLLLWERSRGRSDDDAKPQAERLLIGLNPQTVQRVRFRWGDRSVELVKKHGNWEPATGNSVLSTVRVDLLLQRIATLRVRLMRRQKRRGRRLGKPLADIKVWRGRTRAVIVRFYATRGSQKPSGVLVTTTDRPGVYRADAKLLKVLKRELRQPQLPTVWPLKIDKVASVELKGKVSVTLVRRSGRWHLADNAAYAPADQTAVGRLLRAIQAMQVTHKLGKGAALVSKHGLDKPRITLKVDDGTKRTLLVGGACPRSPGAKVATRGGSSKAVFCVSLPDHKAFRGPFVNTRLFSTSADEIKAINVTRGKQTLALVNRPGSGGWAQISPDQRKVDQVAAASFVADVARLNGQLPDGAVQSPPPKAKRVGSVLLTPLVGSEERLELHATHKSPRLWARRMGGSRWFKVRLADQRLLTADPVLLRSRSLCNEPGKKFLHVVKTHPGRVTELLASQRGNWQLVLLAGRVGFAKAKRIGSKLQDYRPAAKAGATAPQAIVWKRPVLLVGQADRAHLNTLLFQLRAIRALGFVGSQALKEHGFGGGSLQLSYRYLHSCKVGDLGKKVCQQAQCSLELGADRAGGGCYARQTGQKAVFLASAPLCKAARSPVASRRVVGAAIHRLASITLLHKGKKRRLFRVPGRGWKRPKEISALAWESATGVLLQLAPMTARSVAGYGRGDMGAVEISVVLKIKEMPAIRLDFYDDTSDPAHRWMVRKGLPVRYKVSSRMVAGLLRLAAGK